MNMAKSAKALAVLSDDDIRPAVFQIRVECRTEPIFCSLISPSPNSPPPLPSPGIAPFPVSDFRQILPVFLDVLLVLDQLVLKLLLQVDALVADLR